MATFFNQKFHFIILSFPIFLFLTLNSCWLSFYGVERFDGNSIICQKKKSSKCDGKQKEASKRAVVKFLVPY